MRTRRAANQRMRPIAANAAQGERHRSLREEMIENATLKRWSAEYEKQRAAGAPGWAGAASYRLKQDRIAEALAEHRIPPSPSFLELGCGAGNIALWMASRGFAAFGVDVVREAIKWATDKATEAASAAQFVVGDLAHLPMFQEGQFDVIFDGDCFHMITGPHRAVCFREVRRILKHGGLLIAGGNVRDESFPDTAARRILTPDGLEYVLNSEAEWCQELTDAGFTVLCVKHHPKRGSTKVVKESIAVHATRTESREPAGPGCGSQTRRA